MRIVFASSNKGKIREIQGLLAGHHEVIGLEDIGVTEEIPETADTISENSFLKANYVKKFLERAKMDYAVFADDSGLEVQELNGEPGVRSARYAGEPKNDEANMEKLLRELQHVTNRKARFVTVITLITDNHIEKFEGEINGTIAYEPRGHYGFGYDPVFIPQGYRSTFAELNPEIKNAVSHRAKAVNQLISYLKKQ